MFKKLLCLLLVLTAIFSLSSCGGEKGLDAQLVYPIDKDPGYLDPQIIYDIGAKNIIANCFEGLVALDGEGNIIPASAERWETNTDNTVYTFYLRQDLMWKVTSAAGKVIGEDYKETFDARVTAHDFDFGITRALLPETKCPEASSLFAIKNAKKVNKGTVSASELGVTALDDYTLRITLSHADPDFLYTLLESCCMPCNEEFFEKTGGRYGLATRYLIYNGPFYINNWADDSSISVRRSDAYYDNQNVKPYSVYYSMNNEQPTRLKKLTDETYSVTPLTKSQAHQLENKKNYTVNTFSSSVKSLVFNCGDENLSNLNIRRAIVSSFDYSLLKDIVGAQEESEELIPDAFLTGTIKFGEYRKTAEKYVSGSPLTVFRKGLGELEKNGMEVTVLCSAEDETLVRSLMQSWQSVLGVGFTVYVESTDEVSLKERVSKGDFQMALTPVTFTGNRVYGVLNKFRSDSKENFVSFSDKKYDKLLADMRECDSIATYSVAAKKAEQYLITNCVAVPLYKENNYYALGKKVSGVIHNISGEILYFKNTVKER